MWLQHNLTGVIFIGLNPISHTFMTTTTRVKLLLFTSSYKKFLRNWLSLKRYWTISYCSLLSYSRQKKLEWCHQKGQQSVCLHVWRKIQNSGPGSREILTFWENFPLKIKEYMYTEMKGNLVILEGNFDWVPKKKRIFSSCGLFVCLFACLSILQQGHRSLGHPFFVVHRLNFILVLQEFLFFNNPWQILQLKSGLFGI